MGRSRDGNCVYVHRSTTGSVALDAPMAGSLTWTRNAMCDSCSFRDLHEKEMGVEGVGETARRIDAARVAGCSPAKQGDSISTVPAL